MTTEAARQPAYARLALTCIKVSLLRHPRHRRQGLRQGAAVALDTGTTVHRKGRERVCAKRDLDVAAGGDGGRGPATDCVT